LLTYSIVSESVLAARHAHASARSRRSRDRSGNLTSLIRPPVSSVDPVTRSVGSMPFSKSKPGGRNLMEMRTLHVKINGRDYQVPDGSTILGAARAYANIEIPTLCYLEGISEEGACGVCVVDVKVLATFHVLA